MNKFKEFYSKNKELLENEIKNYNEKLLEEKNEILLDNLRQFTQLNSGGKRIRGLLILLGYYLKNNDIKYALPLSVAYEFFQTSILVHDDVIDNDNLRRGNKTIPFYNEEKYNIKDKDTFNSIGICIGDYGLYYSNSIIINNYEKDLKSIFDMYNKIVLDTIKGETIDVMLPFKEKNNLKVDNLEEEVFNIYRLKTAYYTIVGPLSLGMKLANFSLDEISKVREFSTDLGIAFQIYDDLIGIYKDEKEIGKVVGTDIEEFKQTILYAYIKNTKYYDELMKYYGKIPSTSDIYEVRRIYEESGAKDYALNKCSELYNDARKKLDEIDFIKKDKKELLYELINYLEERSL